MQKSSSYFQRVPKHILVEAIKLAYLIFTFINSWTIFFVIQSINRLVTLTKKKKTVTPKQAKIYNYGTSNK